MTTAQQIQILQEERNAAFHAWNASKNKEDLMLVKELDAYLTALRNK